MLGKGDIFDKDGNSAELRMMPMHLDTNAMLRIESSMRLSARKCSLSADDG